jgi:hypothetical protein
MVKKKSINYMEGLKAIRDGKCPVCGSDLVNREKTININDRNYSREIIVNCLDCRAFWTLHYDFTGYGEIGIDTEDGYGDRFKKVAKIRNNLPTRLLWPEILQAVLSQKKMLPALLGIDDKLDKIIAERLKK